MKRKTLCLLSVSAALMLAGCNPTTTSSVKSTASSTTTTSVAPTTSEPTSTTTSTTSEPTSTTTSTTSEPGSSTDTTSTTPTTSSPEPSSSESSQETSQAPAILYTITGVDLVNDNGAIKFSVTGTYDASVTMNSPVVKITSAGNSTGTDDFSGTIVPDSAAHTWSATVDVTAVSDDSWHDIKIYFDSTAAATGEIDKTVLSDEMYGKTAVGYSHIAKLTFGFQNWENNLKLAVTFANLFVANSVNLATDTSNKVTFTVSGTIDEHLVSASPVLKVTSDANSTETADSFTGDITVDAAAKTFTVSVDITAMTNTSWHDIKIYWDSANTAFSEISKSDLSDAMYALTATIPNATGKTVFAFTNYGGKLKIFITLKDNLETQVSSLYFAAETDGAYLHCAGKNTHEGAKFFVGTTASPLGSADIANTGDFDVKIRVDNIDSANYIDSNNKRLQINLNVSYTDESGNAVSNELTNQNVTNKVNLAGASYGGYDYVFTTGSWNGTYWYKLTRTTDDFAMDTVRVSADTAGTKAMLNISGTINVTKPNVLGTVSLKLNGDANDVNGTTTLASYDIPAASISAAGYVNASIDITEMASTGASSLTHLGGLQLWNSTTDSEGAVTNTKLNSFWPGDWTQGNDVLNATVGSYKYVVSNGSWGEYCLDKVAA